MAKPGNQNYKHQPFPKMVNKDGGNRIVNNEDELAAAIEDGFTDPTARRTAKAAPAPKAEKKAEKKAEPKAKVAPKPAEPKGPITL